MPPEQNHALFTGLLSNYRAALGFVLSLIPPTLAPRSTPAGGAADACVVIRNNATVIITVAEYVPQWR